MEKSLTYFVVRTIQDSLSCLSSHQSYHSSYITATATLLDVVVKETWTRLDATVLSGLRYDFKLSAPYHYSTRLHRLASMGARLQNIFQDFTCSHLATYRQSHQAL